MNLSLLLLFLALSLATALPSFPDLLPNGNSSLRSDSGITCLFLGHTDCQPGTPRIQFGLDFDAAGREWTVALCQMDSDGDGLTNGEELGDPCCLWTPTNGSPLRLTMLSHPGLASETGAREAPGCLTGPPLPASPLPPSLSASPLPPSLSAMPLPTTPAPASNSPEGPTVTPSPVASATANDPSPSISASPMPSSSTLSTPPPSAAPITPGPSLSISANPTVSQSSAALITPGPSLSISANPTVSQSSAAPITPGPSLSISANPTVSQSSAAPITPGPSLSISANPTVSQSSAVPTTPDPPATPPTTPTASAISGGTPSAMPTFSGTPSPSASSDMEIAAPTPDSDDGVCFPSHATVRLESGHLRRMDQLSIGDRVHVGNDMYSEVFLFTHKLSEVTHEFLTIRVGTVEKIDATISLTRGHFLYVNGQMATAGSVKTGDMLQLENGNMRSVVDVQCSTFKGLFNPQTAHGDIVVDGIRASTYTTAVKSTVAHSLLVPLRALYTSLGWATTSLENGASSIVPYLP